MGQPIKLIQKKSAVRKDGTSIIFIQYCYSADERTLLNSGIAIPPNLWNKKTSRISEKLPDHFGDVQTLQSQLTRLMRKAEDMVTYALRKKKDISIEIFKG